MPFWVEIRNFLGGINAFQRKILKILRKGLNFKMKGLGLKLKSTQANTF